MNQKTLESKKEIVNKITESFGAKPLFKNMDEFDRLMRSDCPVIL